MKGTILLVMLALLGWNLPGNDGVPVAISPGSDAGVAAVGNGCPTFSWSGVAWAQKYRVVVFGVEGERTRNNGEPALTAQPVLSEDVAGGGYSWTPSLSRGLAAGADYAWCVGAMDADGAWSWSATRRFRVEQGTRSALNEEDTAAMKDKKETAAAGTATDACAGNDAGKKDATDIPSSPMGLEGTANTTWGLNAGASLTTGSWNTFIGRNAGNATASASNNTFIGDSSGILNSLGRENTFVGRDSGYHNSTGDMNTFIGDSAGVYNTSGNYNTFVGIKAGQNNTTGNWNTFLGYYAGSSTTSSNNTFIGPCAGNDNTTGNSNTFIGYRSGYNNTVGNHSIFLGCEAGYNETDSNKLYIDSSSTQAPLIYGEFDNDLVRINGTLETKITGINNVLAVTRTDGAQFKLSAMAGSGQIGTTTDHALNFMTNNVKRLTVLVNGNVGIGVTQPSYPLHMASGAYCSAGGKWTDASSITLKQDIAPLNAAAAAAVLSGLNPVTYAYKADASEKCVGFIAEEVPELVAMNDRKSLAAMDIVAVLTKVVQEQQQTIAELKAQQRLIPELQQRLADLERKLRK